MTTIIDVRARALQFLIPPPRIALSDWIEGNIRLPQHVGHRRRGVEPRFERLTGTDQVAVILSANMARRQMSKGQMAVVAAMAFPETVIGRGKKSPAAVTFPMVTQHVSVVADAKYANMFRVQLDDGTTSDMLNHDRAQELARLWGVTPPVRRKSVRTSSAPAPAHASTAAPQCPADPSTVNPPIILIVTPSLQPDGRKAYNNRGQLFDGRVDGRIIVKRSPTPFCDAARVLLAEGCDPATRFNMRHDGSTTDALIAEVGVAAKLTVRDGNGPPEFRSWMPFPGMEEPPPVRQNELAAT